MPGFTFTIRLLGAAATVLLASACGSNTVTPTTSATPGGALGVASTSLGTVLVDSKGLTVYLLTADSPGKSTCDAKCLQPWPLVPAPAGTSVPKVPGVSAAVGVTKATTGESMLTAGGWPLYTFAQDKAPGDVNGQGKKSFGGTWYVVSPSGEAVTAAPPTAPPAGNGVGGY